MAIPKKGSRKIVVDDVVYRWRIRWKPTILEQDCPGYICAAAELYENPKGFLHIFFPWGRYDDGSDLAKKPVTPKMVEQSIKQALKGGWKPSEQGNHRIVYEVSEV